MPELPDIVAYLDALTPRVVNQPVERVRVLGPSLLRTVEPPPEALVGRRVFRVGRIGKQVVFHFDAELYLVVHLMIAGRFRWLEAGKPLPGRITQAALDFTGGTLALTEAGTRKRATLRILRGSDALAVLHRGGIEPLEADLPRFREALLRENHSLKRALTDPRLFAGIGNAYSDEILYAARLSPVRLTQKLDDAEIARLHTATQETLRHWIDVLRKQFAKRFPGAGDVTAFREDFAVHGRFGKPCRACGHPIQRIRYADNETNYCAGCQTDGRVLADRSLSRLLREDWPRSIEELENPRDGPKG